MKDDVDLDLQVAHLLALVQEARSNLMTTVACSEAEITLLKDLIHVNSLVEILSAHKVLFEVDQ